MRDAFISILALFALAALPSKCADINKDGFNFYKDHLRGRSDDIVILDEPDEVDRSTLYFYRTPVQVFPGLLPAALQQKYRKRTGNTFKNHMLGKVMLTEEDLEAPSTPSTHTKRSSKTALSLMMQQKHPYVSQLDSILNEGMDLTAD